MIKESYTENYYTYNTKYINNALSLRKPQHESLEIFARLCDTISLSKNPDLEAELAAVHEMFPTLTSFEREFPSFCFELATGIGKTRLMGACIAYLYYEKGIKNFFVMAPSITIYSKLKSDFGDLNSEKYVFRGLDKFVSPPHIISGENYESFRQGFFGKNDVIINVFNIDKLNSESKTKDGKPSKIKRLNEVLGESYFSYLQSLPDLCILMDESHHYHADKSFQVINELHPILGVEFTATASYNDGSKKNDFKNVVYEYTLGHALQDEMYVKDPVVITKKDFHPEEYSPEVLDKIKIKDGIRLHEQTKSDLEIYSRTYGKKRVKPFVLIVARNKNHAKEIFDFVSSPDFFDGYYADKVVEIHSDQKKVEKDENVLKLLSLEKMENKIEIVIHINMLKEGWDVNNLYTIIPLRASASEILTEQTIGRGLRLPYGDRTGIEEVDRLSIISHDKYSKVIEAANDPNSIVKKIYYMDSTDESSDGEQIVIELPSAFEVAVSNYNQIEQIADILKATDSIQKTDSSELTDEESKNLSMEVASYMTNITAASVFEMNKQIKSFDVVKDQKSKEFIQKAVAGETIRQFPQLNLDKEKLKEVIEKTIDTCVQALTELVIPIPQIVVQPFTEVKHGFTDFELDTSGMHWQPSDGTLIGTELKEGGKTFVLNVGNKSDENEESVENEIVKNIIKNDNVDYATCADLMYSLIAEAKDHFLTYLSEEDTEKVMRERNKTISDIIYSQMNGHFYKEEIKYQASDMRPFSKIENGFGSKLKTDDIYDLNAVITASEIKKKIFKGFKKACHTLYKFDSETERTFAIVLENDSDVLKWLRPSSKQFNIYYGPAGNHKYEPDFIVETADHIYMVETKAINEIDSKDVQDKAEAAREYCYSATEWNKAHDGKPWDYLLIPHNEVSKNSSFKYLINCAK